MDEYDIIISMGIKCVSAIALMDLKYKAESCPFDWTLSNAKIILDCFKDNFNKYCEFENDDINHEYSLNKRYPENYCKNNFENSTVVFNPKHYVNKYGMCFTHYVNKAPIELKELCIRRCNRMIEHLNGNKSLLFLYFNDEPKTDIDSEYENLLNIERYLIYKYPNLKFKIVAILPLEKPSTQNITTYYYNIPKLEINKIYCGNTPVIKCHPNGSRILLNFFEVLLKKQKSKSKTTLFN